MNIRSAYIGSFQNQYQKNVTIATKAQKAIITGDKQVFEKSTDIMVGGQCATKYIVYNSASSILREAISLLDKATGDLEAMHNIAFEMQEIYSNVLNGNFNAEQLVSFDQIFQDRIRALDQIAAGASYFSLSLLNGSMSADHPLTVYGPSREETKIILPDMRNAASPIGNPGPDDPQIQIPSTVAEFDAAINVPLGAPINVLENIKTFCGANSFLYIVANQINEAFTDGLANAGNELPACIAYLQAINWNDLLPPDQALAAATLMQDPNFMNNDAISTIGSNMNLILLGVPQETILYDITHDALARFLPATYITKASPVLSISSPDYFGVVGVRLKEATNYIVKAQISVKNQMTFLELTKDMYNNYSDCYLEQSDRLLKSDLPEESAKLSKVMNNKSLLASIFIFTKDLEQMIGKYYREILKNLT